MRAYTAGPEGYQYFPSDTKGFIVLYNKDELFSTTTKIDQEKTIGILEMRATVHHNCSGGLIINELTINSCQDLESWLPVS